MDDDIGAVLEWCAQIWRGEGVVDDQREPMPMRDVCDRRDVEDIQLRIGDCLGVKHLGIGLHRTFELGRNIGIDESAADAELRKSHRELRIRPAVQRPRRNDMVAISAQGEQACHLGRHSRGDRKGRASAFERRHPLLERRGRRVRQPRVDVAERLQVEQACRMVGVSNTYDVVW
jgi:hypothetical protein